jgi:hypothetical protein
MTIHKQRHTFLSMSDLVYMVKERLETPRFKFSEMAGIVIFCTTFRPAVGPTKSNMKICTEGSFPGGKLLEFEAIHTALAVLRQRKRLPTSS